MKLERLLRQKEDILNDPNCFVMVGNSGVGKTDLLLNFTHRKFISYSETRNNLTIAVEFRDREIKIEDKKVKVQFWSRPGQEHHTKGTTAFYDNINCALILYDVTFRCSFESAEEWLKELKDCAEKDNVTLVLIGTKIDLKLSQSVLGKFFTSLIEPYMKNTRQVSTEEGKEFADRNNLLFFETSAFKGTNVEETFRQIITELGKKS